MGDEIIKVLDALCEKLGLAVDWTNENVLPQVATLGEKIVKYELCTSTVWLVLGGLMVVLSIILWGCAIRINRNSDDIYFDDMAGAVIVIGTFLLLVGVGVCSSQIHDIITCNVFPEKIIYTCVSDLINN